MEGDCNVYAHSSLWMRPTRPDRYNMRMVYTFLYYSHIQGVSETHVVRHGNVKSIQNRSTVTNPTMDP